MGFQIITDENHILQSNKKAKAESDSAFAFFMTCLD